MRSSRSRGFTLLEVMVAGALSLFVVAAAFLAINRTHVASIRHERDLELLSQARSVLELIGRDIRTAGDSVQFLPAHCLGAARADGAPFGCPAVMEPHPWRLTMSRYMWNVGADGIPFTSDDTLGGGLFDGNPENVVSYQFVPDDRSSGNRYVGRLERIVNPFSFLGQAPRRTVLLENVVLDDRMVVSPDGTQTDPRMNHSMFMYRILSTRNGEYVGHATYAQRNTKEGSFILPPVRFFPFPDDPVTWAKNQEGLSPPYLEDYSAQIVGLQPNTTSGGQLLAPTYTKGSFKKDLRYLLDYNRIRAVHVSFKVFEPKEDPDHLTGIDLNPNTPGTARMIQLESTFELKVFSGYLY